MNEAMERLIALSCTQSEAKRICGAVSASTIAFGKDPVVGTAALINMLKSSEEMHNASLVEFVEFMRAPDIETLKAVVDAELLLT